MFPRLRIWWRSAGTTCDFPRLWSESQSILICRLPSESPINTSVDRSYLQPSKSKRVQGRWECGAEDEDSGRPAARTLMLCHQRGTLCSSCYQTDSRRRREAVVHLSLRTTNQFRQCKRNKKVNHDTGLVQWGEACPLWEPLPSRYSSLVSVEESSLCSLNAHRRRWRMMTNGGR